MPCATPPMPILISDNRRQRFQLTALLAVMVMLLAFTGRAAAQANPVRNDDRLLTRNLLAASTALPGRSVLVLLVSLPDCHWCHEIRKQYLLPMQREALLSGDLSVAEVSLTAENLIDFDGVEKSVEQIAQIWAVKAAPTVLFLDRCGTPLVDALVGGDVAGFYGAYLDRALAEARLQAQTRPTDACALH